MGMRVPAGLAAAVLLCAMIFFGWLVNAVPPIFGGPFLPIIAMWCTAFMFAVWLWRRSR